jgi:hypothetical protein
VQRRIASGVDALIGSATPIMPASLPSIATNITVWRRRAQRLRRALELARRPSSSSKRRLPSATACRRPAAVTPLPGDRIESRFHFRRAAMHPAFLRARDDRRRQRMLAAALDARGEPQHVAFVEPARGTTPTTGLPSVSVPVLSTTSVSTFLQISSASAFLISTPACAPRPVPTMIDIGVAKPSAQGQAMIRTRPR